MKSLALLCKQHNTTVSDLSTKVGVPERTIRDYFSTGLMPYILVYKIAEALGTTMNEVVHESVLADWEDLYSKRTWARKKRGTTAEAKTKAPTPTTMYLTEAGEIATKPEKIEEPIPMPAPPVAPTAKEPKPKAPVPPKPKKPSLEELLDVELTIDVSELQSLQQESAPQQTDDITKLPISDDFFQVSMGQKV